VESCDRHATPVALTLDAQRGLVCPACDAETIAWGAGVPRRLARWAWRGLWQLD
jgi:hypothetical protein